jgi:hypothetical protein
VSWLFEDPTTMIVAGALIECLLVVALVKSGRAILVVPILAVLALMGLGVLIERLVVTEAEQVEGTLEGVADALEANGVEAVLRYIDPAAAELRSHVKSQMPQMRITDARVYDLVVRVNRYSSPPTVQADFTGRLKGRFRGDGGAGGEGLVLRNFTVEFHQERERWLITGYEDHGTIGGRRDD